jgi:hypothetical protein
MWVTVWLIGLSYTKTTFIRTGDMCVNDTLRKSGLRQPPVRAAPS